MIEMMTLEEVISFSVLEEFLRYPVWVRRYDYMNMTWLDTLNSSKMDHNQ